MKRDHGPAALGTRLRDVKPHAPGLDEGTPYALDRWWFASHPPSLGEGATVPVWPDTESCSTPASTTRPRSGPTPHVQERVPAYPSASSTPPLHRATAGPPTPN